MCAAMTWINAGPIAGLQICASVISRNLDRVGMGTEGDFECSRLGEVLQRSDNRPIHVGTLEREILPGAIDRGAIDPVP